MAASSRYIAYAWTAHKTPLPTVIVALNSRYLLMAVSLAPDFFLWPNIAQHNLPELPISLADIFHTLHYSFQPNTSLTDKVP
jgi:hypothetical protein